MRFGAVGEQICNSDLPQSVDPGEARLHVVLQLTHKSAWFRKRQMGSGWKTRYTHKWCKLNGDMLVRSRLLVTSRHRCSVADSPEKRLDGGCRRLRREDMAFDDAA